MTIEQQEIDNWYGWLTKRIPGLEPSYNELWIKQALQGYAEWYHSKQLEIAIEQQTFFIDKSIQKT